MKKISDLSDWISSTLGERVLAAEAKCLSLYLEQIKGDCLLFLGDPLQKNLLKESRFKQIIAISPNYDPAISMHNLICARYEELPIAPNSISAVLLPHTLDFSDDYRRVLNEVNAVLQAEGDLIIIGFNPFSLFGIRHIFSSHKKTPWLGKFRSVWRIKKWLRELNFSVIRKEYIFYEYPLETYKVPKWVKFLAWLVKMVCPVCGGVYVIHAKKKVFGMTKLTVNWGKIPEVVNNTIAKPATRGFSREQNS